MLFEMMTEDIVGVDSFDRWMFALDSEITSVYFLGSLRGVPILSIKLILEVLISILFIITPNHNAHPFFITPFFCNKPHICVLISWLEMIFYHGRS